MRYEIDNDKVSKKEFYERLKEEAEYEAEETFNDFLNHQYEEVVIYGQRFTPAEIMAVDKEKYDLALSNYKYSIVNNYRKEVEQVSFVNINCSWFEIRGKY